MKKTTLAALLSAAAITVAGAAWAVEAPVSYTHLTLPTTE